MRYNGGRLKDGRSSFFRGRRSGTVATRKEAPQLTIGSTITETIVPSEPTLVNEFIEVCECTVTATDRTVSIEDGTIALAPICDERITFENGVVSLTPEAPAGTYTAYLDVLDETGAYRTALHVSRGVVTGTVERTLHPDCAVQKLTDDFVASGPDKECIYTTQDHTNGIYVRSTTSWANEFDVSCISPWNSNSANRKCGTLVTPQDILVAWHYKLSVNDTIRFVDMNGSVYTRTVDGVKSLSDASLSRDITVCHLDSPLPAAIKPAVIMPDNLSDWSSNSFLDAPVCYTDQEEKAQVWRIYRISEAYTSVSYSKLIGYESYWEVLVGGDSGSAAGIMRSGKPFILTSVATYSSGSGSNIIYHKTEINEILSDLGSIYTLTEADLSDYPKISELTLP